MLLDVEERTDDTSREGASVAKLMLWTGMGTLLKTPAAKRRIAISRMRKSAVALLLLSLIVLLAEPAHAWYRWRGGVFIGVGPYWAPRYPYWWAPPYPYWWGPPYYGYGPPMVFDPPTVYLQQQAPAPPPPPPPPVAYWYYCLSARSYYPSVETCPEPWVKVPPRPE